MQGCLKGLPLAMRIMVQALIYSSYSWYILLFYNICVVLYPMSSEGSFAILVSTSDSWIVLLEVCECKQELDHQQAGQHCQQRRVAKKIWWLSLHHLLTSVTVQWLLLLHHLLTSVKIAEDLWRMAVGWAGLQVWKWKSDRGERGIGRMSVTNFLKTS